MKQIKKLLIVFVLVLVVLLIGCSYNEEKLKVIVPSGTPLVSIGPSLNNKNYEIEIVSGSDLLSSALIKGEYDIVIAPINLGAKLYLKGNNKYALDSVITTGNSYLINLNNKPLSNDAKILAFGMNNTADIMMKLYLGDLSFQIEYQSAVSDVIPFIISGSDYDYYLVSEPFLSQLKIKYQLNFTIIDLEEEIDEISFFPQAGIYVNKESNNSLIDKFITETKENIEFLNENSEDYYEKVKDSHSYFKNLTESVLESSIKLSKIRYIKASSNKDNIIEYFNLLNDFNNKILEGEVPDEAFFR